MKRKQNSSEQQRSERGQVIVILMILITALIGIVALAVDGGRVYYAQRTAQNAADNASLAGALALCTGGNVTSTALASAAANGFNNDGSSNTVTVNNPPTQGPNSGDGDHVEVFITSSQEAAFAQIVFSGPLQSTVRSVGKCGYEQILEHALFAGSNTCQNAVDLAGSSKTIIGGIHSNNDIKISGASSNITGIVTYVSSIGGSGGGIIYDPPPPANPSQVGEVNYPVAFDINDYAPGGTRAVEAQNDGNRYYSCDCEIDIAWLEDQDLYDGDTDTIADGLYYTTDEIRINGNDVIGNAVTFVAREEISISGSSHSFNPYVDGLFAFTDKQRSGGAQCNSSVISMSGSSNSWGGIIFAPNGLVGISGSDSTTLNGSIIAYSINISGSEIIIQLDQGLAPPPPLVIYLAE